MSAEIRHIQTKITASADGFEQTLKGLNRQIENYTKEANRVLDSLPERLAAALSKAGQRTGEAAKKNAAQIESISRELRNREKKLTEEGIVFAERMARQEAGIKKKAILETVEDRRTALKLIAQLEKVTQAEIKALHDDAARKAKAAADAAAAAQIAAAKRAADAVKKFEAEKAAERKAALQAGAGFGVAGGVAAAGGAAGIGAAIAEYAALESVIVKIGAVSNSTTAEMDRLKQAAIDSGMSSGFGAQAAAEGLEELALAGFTANESMTALNDGLMLARAGGVEVDKAMDLLGGTIRGFGLEAKDSAMAADVLAATANKSAVSMKQIQLSFKYIAPVAQAANQSLQEMAAAVAIMGNNMIRGEQAGTTMRSALIRLTDPPKEAADAMHKLGISIQSPKGEMLSFGVILDQIRNKTKEYTAVQRTAALSQIFGTEALSGTLALMNAGSKAYDRMVREMYRVEGANKAMADRMSQGVGPAMQQAANNASIAAAAFGEQFAPAVRSAAGLMAGFTKELSIAPPFLKALAAGAAVAGVAFLGLAGAISAAVLAMGPAVLAMGLLGGPVGLSVAALAALSLALGGFVVYSRMAADASAATARRLEIDTKERENNTQALIDSRDELSELVAEHDRLIDVTNRTAAEQERLDQITKLLKEKYPQLASALDQATSGHWATIVAVQNEIRNKEALIRTNIKAAESELMLARAALGRAKAVRTELAADTRSYGERGIGAAGEAANRNSAAASEAAAALEIKQREASLMNLQTMLDKSMESRSIMLSTSSVPLGSVVPAGSKPKKSKAGGSGKADTAARQEYAADKALAEERMKLAQLVADRLTGIEKARIERQMAQLTYDKEALVVTEEAYINRMAALKLASLATDERAALYRVGLEKKKTQDLIKEAHAAGKVKADEENKLKAQLITLQAQEANIRQDYADKRLGIAQETTHAIAAHNRKSAEDSLKLDADIATERERIEGDSLKNRLAGITRDFDARIKEAEKAAATEAQIEAIKANKIAALTKAKEDAVKASRKALRDSGPESLANILTAEAEAYAEQLKSITDDTSESYEARANLAKAYANRVEELTTNFNKRQLDQLEDLVSASGSTWSRMADPAIGAMDRIGVAATALYSSLRSQIANGLAPTLTSLWESIGGPGVRAIGAMAEAWIKAGLEATKSAAMFAAARLAAGDPIAVFTAAVAAGAAVMAGVAAILDSDVKKRNAAADAVRKQTAEIYALNAAMSDNLDIQARGRLQDAYNRFENDDEVKAAKARIAQLQPYIDEDQAATARTGQATGSMQRRAAEMATLQNKLAKKRLEIVAPAEKAYEDDRQDNRYLREMANYEHMIGQAEAVNNQFAANEARSMKDNLELFLKLQEQKKQGLITQDELTERLEEGRAALETKYAAADAEAREEAFQKVVEIAERASVMEATAQRNKLEAQRATNELSEAEYQKGINLLDAADDKRMAEKYTEEAKFYTWLSEQAGLSAEAQAAYQGKAMEAIANAQAVVSNVYKKAQDREMAVVDSKYKKKEEDYNKEITRLERLEAAELKVHETAMKAYEAEARPLERQLAIIRERIRLREEEANKAKALINKEDAGKFKAAVGGMTLGATDAEAAEKLITLRARLAEAVNTGKIGLADYLRQEIGDIQNLTFEGIETQQKINESRFKLEEITADEFAAVAANLSLRKAKLAEKELKDENISNKERARIQAVYASAYEEWRETQLDLIDRQTEAANRLDEQEANSASNKLAAIEAQRATTSYAISDIRAKYAKLFDDQKAKIDDNKIRWEKAAAAIKSSQKTLTDDMVTYWNSVSTSIGKALDKARALAALGGKSTIDVFIPTPGGGFTLPVALPGFAEGGIFQGGTPGKDSINARVMPGEHIASTSLTNGLIDMVGYFRQLAAMGRLMPAAAGGMNQTNNFNFNNAVIRDERDIRLLAEQVSYQIARQT